MTPWVPEDEQSSLVPDQQEETSARVTAGGPVRYLDFILLCMIFAVTLFIRVWQLDKVPPDVMPDEADSLNSIYRILLGNGVKFFDFTWDGAYGAVNAYLQAWSVQLFGLENTVLGIRMSAAFISALSVIPFFWLIRWSFGRWVALFATLLFSSSWWHLNLSRTAWPLVFVLPCALMMLWLAEMGLRAPWRRALLLFTLSGVFVSFCLYGYPAAKALVLALGLYLGFEWLMAVVKRWRSRRGRAGKDPTNARARRPAPVSDDPTMPTELVRHRWAPPPARPALIFGGTILLGIVALIIFVPQLGSILKNWETYITRPRAVSITSVQLPYEGALTWPDVYKNQVKKVFDAWVLMRGTTDFAGGVQIRYNPPGESFLDPVTRVLFLLGLPLSLLTWRRSLIWWLFWVISLVSIQVLTTGIPDGAKAVVTIPSVYFFVACSIYWILKLPAYISRRIRVPRLARVSLIAAALVCAGLVVYNVRHYWDWMYLPATSDARQPSVELDEFEEWQYLQWDLAKNNKGAFSVDDWHAQRGKQPVGLVVAYYRSLDRKGVPDWLRRGAQMALAQDSPVDRSQPFAVSWNGYLLAPTDGTYEFSCASDGECEFYLDEQKILSGSGGTGSSATGSIMLTAAPHRVVLTYKHLKNGVAPDVRFTWKPPAGVPGSVPPEMLRPTKRTISP